MSTAAKSPLTKNPTAKFLLDLGPLLLFFAAYSAYGIYAATATLMVATVISLGLGYVLERRIALMPVVTCVVVMVFGGLTLLLEDELFIKLKPTIIYLTFAVILFTGLALGRPFVRNIMQAAIQLTDRGWKILTFRFAAFFVSLAVLNEIVWRNFSTDTWVNFKVWGFFPLTVLFFASQLPLMIKHEVKSEETAPNSAAD
jgi:intracellular septation protein